jgi:hypothetical protein
MRYPGLKELHAGPGYHHSVVGAERWRRESDIPALLCCDCGCFQAQFSIGSGLDVSQLFSQLLVWSNPAHHHKGSDRGSDVVEIANGSRETIFQMSEGNGLEGSA